MTANEDNFYDSAEEEAEIRQDWAAGKERDQEAARLYAQWAKTHPVFFWDILKLGPWDRKLFFLFKWFVGRIAGPAIMALCWAGVACAAYYELWWLCILFVAARTARDVAQPFNAGIRAILRWTVMGASLAYEHARGNVNPATRKQREEVCKTCDKRKLRDIRVWEFRWRRPRVRRCIVNRVFCRGVDPNTRQSCGCPDTRFSACEHRWKLMNAECIAGMWGPGCEY